MSAIAEAGAPPPATTSSPSLPQMARAEEAAAQPRPQRRRRRPAPPPLLLLLLLASAVLGGGRALQSSPPPPAGRLRSGGGGSGTSAAGAGAGGAGAGGPLLVVDLYNALGHTGFGLGPEALVLRAAAWRSSRRRRGAEGMGTEKGAGGMAEVPPLCFVVDHGSSRSSHAGGPLPPGIGMTFAGPGGLTADDVIVGLVRERFGGGGEEEGGGEAPARNSTVVVTADAGLIGRCRRQAREAAGGSWAGSGGNTGTGTGTATAEDGLAFVEPMSFLRELEAHSHADGSLFGRDVAVEVLSTPREEKAEKGAEEGQEDGAGGEAAPPAGAGESQRGGEGLAAELASAESAIERTLRARRRLVKDRRGKKRARAGRAGRSSSSSRAASRSQRARAATDARRGEAERLREGLVRAGTVHTDEAPVRALLGWLAEAEEEEEAGGAKWTGAAADAGDGGGSGPLGLGLDGGRDPLGCVVRVPRRGGGAGGSLAEGGSDTVRLVVISDTHGFEAALGALPSPEDPAAGAGGGASGGERREGGTHLLPDADILVHCGDFAANGSRARQRESVRKLDAFLADQAHIPHKVVVMGNHDPKIPGRTLFPKSGAVYATTARRLRLGGLRMAVEPFSRRSYARIAQATENVSNADVLISHEPPHGTLDLTYSGTRAGSRALREAVVSAETKPRAWLCGHIHEGRGLAREMFDRGESECAPTLVVNAANANVGKARRLVTGAVLIDIEREDRGEGGRERDGAGADAWDQLVQLDTKRDLGLDPIHVRPGVRRRKGVPSSSRSRQRRK